MVRHVGAVPLPPRARPRPANPRLPTLARPRAHRAPLAAHSPRGPRCLRLTPLLTHAADGEALYRHKAEKWKGGRGRLEMSEIGEEEGNMSRAALTRAERLASVPLWSMHKYSGLVATSVVWFTRENGVSMKKPALATTVPWTDCNLILVCIATSARWWRVPWR